MGTYAPCPKRHSGQLLVNFGGPVLCTDLRWTFSFPLSRGLCLTHFGLPPFSPKPHFLRREVIFYNTSNTMSIGFDQLYQLLLNLLLYLESHLFIY